MIFRKIFVALVLGLCSQLAHAADNGLRDIQADPLTEREKKAYKMALTFALQFGDIRTACVNPDKPEREPIIIQFTEIDAKGNSYCAGSEYAVSVELDMYNNVTSISLTGDDTYTSYQDR